MIEYATYLIVISQKSTTSKPNDGVLFVLKEASDLVILDN